MPTELTPVLRTYKSMKVMSPAYQLKSLLSTKGQKRNSSAVDSGGARGARAPSEFGGSENGQSLISAYRSLAITASTSGFEKLSTALSLDTSYKRTCPFIIFKTRDKSIIKS